MLEKDKKILEAWNERHQFKPIISLMISWIVLLLWILITGTLMWVWSSLLNLKEVNSTLMMIFSLHLLIMILYSFHVGIRKHLGDAIEESIIYYIKKKEGIL